MTTLNGASGKAMYEAQFPLLDHMSLGIFAIDTDANIVLWNKTMEGWTKQLRDDVRGNNLFTLFPTTASDAFRLRIEQVLAGGAPVIFSTQLHHHLIPSLLPDGSFRAQLVTLDFLPEYQIALFSIQDQTEQMRLTERYKISAQSLKEELNQRKKLRKRNKQLVMAMNQAAEAILITNKRGHIEYVNQAFVQQTGWLEDDAKVWLSYADFFAQSNVAFAHTLCEVFEARDVWVGRQSVHCKDGTSFMASISIAPILNKEDVCTHYIIIQEDISQQINIEEKIRNTQKQEALVTLIGGIAHDFNNLLAGMVGQVYLASREVSAMPKTAERMKKIQASAQGAAEIVKQLLTFARQGEHHAKDFSLQSFINEFVKLAQFNVPENIKLLSNFDLGAVSFRGDANQLQQALLNIVQNSVEACADRDHSCIEIHLSPFRSNEHVDLLVKYPVLRHGNFAHIQIRDNGVGMDDDTLGRIFDPFFSTKQLGSGLGLAMVMGCVHHHHGIIDVESRVGEGSCCHLFLPISRPKSDVQVLSHIASTQCVNILLVDDDERVLESTQELLECMGHHVVVAHDGHEACAVFAKQSDHWDLLITDIVMPRMDGVVASKEMRKIRPDLPVIYATGYDQSLVSKGLLDLKNTLLISKPFNPDELDNLIHNMVK